MSVVSIIDKHIGAPKQDGPRELVFIFTRIDRLGHIGYEPYFVRSLFPNFDQYFLVTPNPESRPIANRAVFDLFCRGMTWVPVDEDEINNYAIQNYYGNPNYGVFSIGSRVYALINETSLLTMMCAFVGGGGSIEKWELTDDQVAMGRELERALGIQNDQPVVTLHVREHNPNRPFDHFARSFDAKIENYSEAIHYLTEQGYAVVRLGDKSMTPIGSSRGRLIDLPFHPLSSELADPYFIWRSKFYLGTTSGPSTIAHALGIPKLLVNCICVPATIGPHDRLIYKTYFSKDLGRCLRYRELVTSRNIEWTSDPEFEQAGIVLGENSPQDILSGVKEMLKTIEHGLEPYSEIMAKFRGIDWIAHTMRVMKRLDPPFFYPYVAGTLPCFDYFADHPELIDDLDISSTQAASHLEEVMPAAASHLVPTTGWAAPTMPKWLARFPEDLFHPLSSSKGCYQDGWVDAVSRFTLPGGGSDTLILRGMIPLLDNADHHAILEVKVGGVAVDLSSLGIGSWEVNTPIPPSGAARTIDLIFSADQTLPAPDGRSAAALIRSIGLLSAMPG